MSEQQMPNTPAAKTPEAIAERIFVMANGNERDAFHLLRNGSYDFEVHSAVIAKFKAAAEAAAKQIRAEAGG